MNCEDASVAGSEYIMKASPSFAHFIRETAKQVPHPTVTGSTLWDARNDRGMLYGNLSDEAIVQMSDNLVRFVLSLILLTNLILLPLG